MIFYINTIAECFLAFSPNKSSEPRRTRLATSKFRRTDTGVRKPRGPCAPLPETPICSPKSAGRSRTSTLAGQLNVYRLRSSRHSVSSRKQHRPLTLVMAWTLRSERLSRRLQMMYADETSCEVVVAEAIAIGHLWKAYRPLPLGSIPNWQRNPVKHERKRGTPLLVCRRTCYLRIW